VTRPSRLATVLLVLTCAACRSPAVDALSDMKTIHWPNGNEHSRGKLINGLPEGTWTYWYQYGPKMEQGSLRAGKRVGPWRRWYPSGQLQWAVSYQDGLREGAYESFYRGGEPLERGAFVRDQRDGTWVRFHPGDKGRTETVYEGGVERSREHLPAVSTGAEVERP
jgi:antitoxin component YwqK of YwqJK toxin-antitoxin module